jgi:AraC-like DNA-binding protein
MADEAMSTRPTIGPGVARGMVALARSRGVDPEGLFELLGADDRALADPRTRLDFEGFARAWSWLARVTGDEGVPFALAENLRVEAYDVMGFACMTAPDARTAIVRLARYQRLFCTGGALELEGSLLLWIREGSLDHGHRLVDESVVAASVSHFRQLTGSVRVQRVFFRHPAPVDPSRHRRFFAAPIEFRARVCGVLYDPATLDLVPLQANDALARYFASVGEDNLAQAERSVTLVERTREMILRELASGAPTIGLVARRLAMSERTLRRQLDGEGVSFRGLVEEVRKERARAVLVEGGCSPGEAAFALGFSDASTFSRAFRRWFGSAPKAFQARGTSGR